MPPPFRPLSQAEFASELMNYPWHARIWRVDMHHTWFPAHADYRSLASIEAMYRFHVHDLGWDDIAQHVSIAPDGVIWTGRDWNKTPASVGGVLNRWAFMFETIGNFDEGHDQLKGRQLESVVFVTRAVQKRFGLPPQALLFHRDVPVTAKTCPGTTVCKNDVVARVSQCDVGSVTQLRR